MADSSEFWMRYKDPRWQKRKAEILIRDDYTCRDCFDKTTTLNVHHAFYRRDAMPWEYADDELRTLCEPCHEQREGRLLNIRRLLGWADPDQLCRAEGYLLGMVAGQCHILNDSHAQGAVEALSELEWEYVDLTDSNGEYGRNFIRKELVGLVRQGLATAVREKIEAGEYGEWYHADGLRIAVADWKKKLRTEWEKAAERKADCFENCSLRA